MNLRYSLGYMKLDQISSNVGWQTKPMHINGHNGLNQNNRGLLYKDNISRIQEYNVCHTGHIDECPENDTP